MPSIRKKTSNRKSTNDRAKLRHKVAEGRKKNRKLAKKNPQWKSRVSKDPGIPNNLPFKDEILAEISEQRRLAAEEKAARKSSKKPLKHVSGSATGDDPSGSDDDGDENVGASVGVNTIRSAHALSLPKKKSPLAQPLTGDDDEPLLMDPAIPDLGTALDAGNVWLYVLDARDPLAHQSAFIESMAAEKKKSLVFLSTFSVTVVKPCHSRHCAKGSRRGLAGLPS
ncbi:hypothetical protein DL93DRAFT_2091557 [Clavulina sp. PMI_390]|nr:hypothetical protein DL93DRAFT_2091557 [Clavulina sp. PMI_390]